jgi:DTW domain-containing protein YfiP
VLERTQRDGTQPLLLFPYEGEAEPLRPFDRPVTLFVPDGNWRQAFKVRARVPGLSQVPCVTLPPGPPSIYRLRSEAHAEGLATIEAIARAMGILEGVHVQDALEHVFKAMVERTLWARGLIATHEVTGGIPEGATRHDPRSGTRVI